MKTSHNIFDLSQVLNVVPFEHYVEEDQLEEGQSYKIGALYGKKLKHNKICNTKVEQLNYIEEIYRRFGDDVDVIIMEHENKESYCVFSINKDKLDISPEDIEDRHKETLLEWAELLRGDFDFKDDLVGIVMLGEDEELYLKSII